ncbi:MAG: helix-turn-helix transcriptional regulator [Muribaculaceae bacterium]|nr:helix-turn-helix transcriptional regulator [Muribaculaceae bacterium]
MRLRIKELREEKGYFQRNIADYLGCTQQTYAPYENGEIEPTVLALAALSKFYNVSVEYLMGLTDDPKAYDG